MGLQSDLLLEGQLFNEDIVPDDQKGFNNYLSELTVKGPRWFEIGAPAYRKLREEGKTVFPARKVLENGRNIEIPSREAGRSIPCRVLAPTTGKKSKGLMLHFHGGGWVLQSHLDYDPFCQKMADDSSVTVISAGYRLAPEHPFPAATDDCKDVAEYLVKNGEAEFGGSLQVVTGESAGGHLALVTGLHLLSLPQPYLGLKALVLTYGCFDLSQTPASKNFNKELILSKDFINAAVQAFVPQGNADPLFLKRPDVSPFYADLSVHKQLPPALYTCGTADPLIEDTLFMGVRWLAAGAETVVKIFPGLAHGFATFDPATAKGPAENFAAVAQFLDGKLE